MRPRKMRFKAGDRVQAIRLGYGKGAGDLVEGVVIKDSYGPQNYIHVAWDDGDEDFGFAHNFRHLRKLGYRHRARLMLHRKGR